MRLAPGRWEAFAVLFPGPTRIALGATAAVHPLVCSSSGKTLGGCSGHVDDASSRISVRVDVFARLLTLQMQ